MWLNCKDIHHHIHNFANHRSKLNRDKTLPLASSDSFDDVLADRASRINRACSSASAWYAFEYASISNWLLLLMKRY